MGACGSKPEGCVGRGLRLPRKRRRRSRRRASSRRSDLSTTTDPSFRTPTFQAAGTVDAAWLDFFSANNSDDDDDFYSFREDMVSLNGSESGTTLSPRAQNSTENRENISSIYHCNPPKRHNNNNGEGRCVSDASKNGNMAKVQPNDCDSNPCENEEGERGNERNEGSHGRILQNGCLPCIASTSSLAAATNRRALTSATSNLRKRALSKLSFKLKEGYLDQPLISPKGNMQRPVAGSSVPCCPRGKRLPDCWSPINPNTFKVRGKNYLRDKKKDSAPNVAAFYPFGVDVFLSQKKIDHIARFVELPSMSSTEAIPPIFVVNIQFPLYPASLFQTENDGEGVSLVLYFKISETYSSLPSTFRENITRLINDETERVRGFPLDNVQPFRDRLKILGRMVNVEDLQLTAAEKKLLNAYNEKPVLSRPQHEFYLGENYWEIDLDVHRFSYISRRGFETFYDRIKLSILDFGLTIQGNKVEDLPEHLLSCIRLNEIDFTNYHQLGL